MTLLARRIPCGRVRLRREVRAAVAAAAGAVRRRTPVLSIVLLGDRRMRRLNRDFHGADETTDVLAFPLDGGGDEVAGEVIVAVPVAYREARARGLPPLTEILLYVVHGTLHLLGEDDDTRPRSRRMRRLERRALSRLGYPLPRSHLTEVK